MVIKPDKETYHFKKAGQKKVHISLRLLDLDPLLGERRNRGAFTGVPSHIIKGRPFGVGFECLAHSLQERNTLYD